VSCGYYAGGSRRLAWDSLYQCYRKLYINRPLDIVKLFQPSLYVFVSLNALENLEILGVDSVGENLGDGA
jgi:hypothetical protein